MDRADEARRDAGKIPRSRHHVRHVPRKPPSKPIERSISKETGCQKRASGRACYISFEADLRGAEITGWRGDESAETSPCRTAAGRRCVVDGAKRARRADGAASIRCGVPAQMEATAAAAVGGTVRGPDTAAAAGPGRGGPAASGTAAMETSAARCKSR